MILPHPESDLSLNVMVMAADIVRVLKKHRDFTFVDRLMEDFIRLDPRRTPEMFINSATFLFAFGYIEQSGYKLRLDATTVKELPFTALGNS